MGGQTVLNLAIQCEEWAFGKSTFVRMIGVDTKAIDITENRGLPQTHGEIDVPMALKPRPSSKEVAQQFG